MKKRLKTIWLAFLIFLATTNVLFSQYISSITVYERSPGLQTFTFLITDPALYAKGSVDFHQLVGEDYDLYLSDADGTLNENGTYLTIACTHDYFFNENSAANNIDAVSLNLSDGSTIWASIVTSYILGWNQSLEWANLNAALGQPDGVSTRVGSQYSSLTVGFSPPLPKHTLVVSLEGIGDGKITSFPTGIDCGSTCSAAFTEGTIVRLSATPYASAFAHWSGDCTGTTETCEVTMTGNIEVTAHFVPVNSVTVYERTAYVLPFSFLIDDPRLEQDTDFGQESYDFTFFEGGTEVYDVYVSDKDGTPNMQGMYFTIDCIMPWEGTDGCNIDAVSVNYTDRTHHWATEVTAYNLGPLQNPKAANPDAALGPPDDICTYLGNQFSSLTVGFGMSRENKLKIKKVKKNKGNGVVTSKDGYINCGESCSYIYYKENVVKEAVTTLSATAGQGSTFTGWLPESLNCAGTDPCTVTIDEAKTVQAIFVGDYRLKVVNQSKKGGTGIVTSNLSGINCLTGSKVGCEIAYPCTEQVTLSATADPGYTFLGWTPTKLCSGTGDCIVTMDKKRIVKAVFSGP